MSSALQYIVQSWCVVNCSLCNNSWTTFGKQCQTSWLMSLHLEFNQKEKLLTHAHCILLPVNFAFKKAITLVLHHGPMICNMPSCMDCIQINRYVLCLDPISTSPDGFITRLSMHVCHGMGGRGCAGSFIPKWAVVTLWSGPKLPKLFGCNCCASTPSRGTWNGDAALYPIC